MVSIKNCATAAVMGFALGVGLFRSAELVRAQSFLKPAKIRVSAEADLWDTKTRARIEAGNDTLVFVSSEGDVIGELSWGKGKLYFTGTAHGTADNFFINVLKPMVDSYINDNCNHNRKQGRRRDE